jgi:ClpP class serine protease
MTSWKDSLMRRDEVKAAFLEGLKAGAWLTTSEVPAAEQDRLWLESQARKQLVEKPLAG